MVTFLTWQQVAILAFGSWRAVARLCGEPRPQTCARWTDIPARALDALMRSDAAPAWLTPGMLMHGATIDFRVLGEGEAPAPAVAAE